VRKRLKVAIFSTGDEIRDPGQEIEGSKIYDINRFTLRSLLENLGCETLDVGIFRDNLNDIYDGLRNAAKNNDLLITSGGVSKGEEDHVRAALENLGALHTWNLLIKPGRPIALGHVLDDDRQVPLVGLPGNPVAVLVTFLRIARPIILLLSGATQIEPILYSVPAAFSFQKKPGRREWLRASLQRNQKSILNAVKYPWDGSGILSSMVASDGLVELSEATTQVAEGDMIDFLPFKEVM
jgi:molybdopterin molybdotransferase